MKKLALKGLKPCPCCANQATCYEALPHHVGRTGSSYQGLLYLWIECDFCGVQTSKHTAGEFRKREEAIQLLGFVWNARCKIPLPPEPISTEGSEEHPVHLLNNKGTFT